MLYNIIMYNNGAIMYRDMQSMCTGPRLSDHISVPHKMYGICIPGVG